MKKISRGIYRFILSPLIKIIFPKRCVKSKFIVGSKIRYFMMTWKWLNYHNPKDINQKLFWLTRYWQNPLVIKCSDKYLVRDYIKECGCEEILVPLYGVYDTADEINFDNLPNKFVLKVNHGCQYNILCKEKSLLDKEKTIKQLNKWLKTKIGDIGQCYYYDKIPPKIICEQYLEFSGISLIDYKLYCINGNPQFFLVCYDRDKQHVIYSSYSLDWEKLLLFSHEGELEIPKPKYLTEMIKYALILSKPFPFVRVDFYYVNDKIYFGELTFSPNAHIDESFNKDSTLKLLGDKLILPEKLNSLCYFA